MRNIRTLMNEAKRADVIKESQYPFGKGLFEIKTGIGRKKGLTKKQLKAIFDYKSEMKPLTDIKTSGYSFTCATVSIRQTC